MVSLRLPGRFRFVADQAAVSAVEFALILPVMLGLFFGGNELGDALTINRKVSHVASTLSDLVTQSKSVSDTDMSNIFDAASQIMTPYSTTPLKMRITGVQIDNNGNAKVAWSDAINEDPAIVGNPVTLPAGVKQNGIFLVMAEAEYPFTPRVGYVVTGTITLDDTFYLRPRVGSVVCRNASTCSY